VPKRQHTAKDPTHGKAHVCRVPGFLTHGKGYTRQTCPYAVRAPDEHMAKIKTHGKIQSLPCATVVTHGKHEAHGNFLLKKLDSAIATFMGNLLLYVAL